MDHLALEIEQIAKKKLNDLFLYLYTEASGRKDVSGFKSALTEAIAQRKGLPEEYNISLDVVYGYAYSIKKYYMESGNPRQMRGASQNLNQIFNVHIMHYLRGKYKEDCAYYKGGSQIFIIVPHGAGSEIAAVIENEFFQKAPTANNAAVFLPCKINDLLVQQQYGSLKRKLNNVSMKRRMLKYDHNLTDLHCPEPDINKITYMQACHDREVLCGRCRLRVSKYLTEIENDKVCLCKSCTYKEINGGYIERISFKAICKEKGEKLVKNVKINISKEINTTKALQDKNGNIALVYADVNNLGGAGLYAKDLIGDKIFFEAVEDAVTTSLYQAVILAMKKYQESDVDKSIDTELKGIFEIIAVGGDDICLLLPGQIALYAAVQLVKEFEATWKKKYEQYFEKITGRRVHLSISAGIALAHYSTPLTYMEQAAEQLLGSAKNIAHKNRDRANCGAVDILSLSSDGQWAVELDFLRNFQDKRNPLFKPDAKMTMRPFTIDAAEEFLYVLEDIRKLPNHMLRNIDAACKEMQTEEGSLYFDYLLSRLRKNEDKEKKKYEMMQSVFHRLQNMYGILKKTEPKMYLEITENTEKEWIAPWHDILDLQDQIGG